MSPSAGPEEIQLLQKLEEANRSVLVLGKKILWVGKERQRDYCFESINVETAKNQLHMFCISRALEADRKSLQSLSVQSNTSKHSSVCGHSRQGSISSVMSNQSASSNISNMQYDETGE